MNDESLDKLFARAREAGAHDTSRVEFGFETRVTARRKAEQAFAPWPWRLLPFFAALAIFACWNTWHDSGGKELQLRVAMAEQSDDISLLESITGGSL